jgi:hypothetical protein
MRAGCLVMLAAVRAGAAEVGEPVSIEYHAPAGCPDAREFMWRVSARVPRTRAAAPGEKRREFLASIVSAPQGAEGRLVIREADGTESIRTLEAPSCAEVADALALVVALAIDPHASAELPPAPQPQPPQPPPAPPPVPRAPWRFEGGLAGFIATGFAPGGLLGAQISAGAQLDATEFWAPVMRAGFGYVAEQSFAVPGGRASFGWVGGQIELCPMGIHPGPALSWLLCGRGEFGSLRASGSNTVHPRSSSRSWEAVGPGTLFRYVFVRPLALEASASVLFPWTRDRFLIGSAVVHEVPVAVGRAGLGLVVALP